MILPRTEIADAAVQASLSWPVPTVTETKPKLVFFGQKDSIYFKVEFDSETRELSSLYEVPMVSACRPVNFGG